jgi:uncharacterized coiled-coil protein SlyX
MENGDHAGASEPDEGTAARPVEEKLMFLEREIDLLREQIAEVWKDMASMKKRMEQVLRSREEDREEP